MESFGSFFGFGIKDVLIQFYRYYDGASFERKQYPVSFLGQGSCKIKKSSKHFYDTKYGRM